MHKIVKDSLDKKLNYLVVGDIMVDKYILGDVNRISPEAPVPVINVKKHKSNPGGAGNVAVNIAGLNSEVSIIGFTGDDKDFKDLRSDFSSKNIKIDPIIWDKNTITKTRVISGQQQIVRIDHEDSIKPTNNELQKIIEHVNKINMSSFSGIVISDYAKGVCSSELCQRIINNANKKNIPVIVDPKGSAWEKYRGATILTPNLKELSDVYGGPVLNSDDEIERVGLKLLQEYGLS
ncbi:MAG: hypothetical protein B6229_07355, partial [Spirochaetaceae bacterium 4572_7]